MADTKTIGISALITLGLIVASLIGNSYFENPKYYCESKQSIIECPGELSGGLGSRCYLNSEKTSWTTCSSSWIKVTNDLVIQENETKPIIEPEPIEPIPIPTYSGVIKYSCNSKECTRLQ